MFRVRWLLSRIVSWKFHARLWSATRNPLTYYLAALLFLIPGIYSRPIRIYLADGKQIRLMSLMSLYILEEIFLDRVYDHARELPPQTIIDVGANTGMFLIRAKQLWPGCEAVCYEPEPANFRELQNTIAINHLKDVTAVNAAVMPERGEIKLYYHPRNIGGHSVVHHHSENAVVVRVETLDDALARSSTRNCDLLKLDCEGAEKEILNNLNSNTAMQINSIAYEPDERHYSADDLNRRLEQLGYAIVKTGSIVFALRKAAVPQTGSDSIWPDRRHASLETRPAGSSPG